MQRNKLARIVHTITVPTEVLLPIKKSINYILSRTKIMYICTYQKV